MAASRQRQWPLLKCAQLAQKAAIIMVSWSMTDGGYKQNPFFLLYKVMKILSTPQVAGFHFCWVSILFEMFWLCDLFICYDTFFLKKKSCTPPPPQPPRPTGTILLPAQPITATSLQCPLSSPHPFHKTWKVEIQIYIQYQIISREVRKGGGGGKKVPSVGRCVFFLKLHNHDYILPSTKSNHCSCWQDYHRYHNSCNIHQNVIRVVAQKHVTLNSCAKC